MDNLHAQSLKEGNRPPESMLFGASFLSPDTPLPTVKWLWRAATYGLALFAGLSVAAVRIREKFYDGIKQSGTVSPLRLGPGEEALAKMEWPANVIDHSPPVATFGSHPILNRIAIQAASEAAEGKDGSSWQKFWRLAKSRCRVDLDYSREINKVILKDYGIVSGLNPWKFAKGTFQRLIWIGWNNRIQAITAGLATGFGIVGILSLFRENSWLWNKVHALSADQAECKKLKTFLVAQTVETPLEKTEVPTVHTPANDNRPSPRVQTEGIAHAPHAVPTLGHEHG